MTSVTEEEDTASTEEAEMVKKAQEFLDLIKFLEPKFSSDSEEFNLTGNFEVDFPEDSHVEEADRAFFYKLVDLLKYMREQDKEKLNWENEVIKGKLESLGVFKPLKLYIKKRAQNNQTATSN